MSMTIEDLEIQVEASSTSAESKLNALSQTLAKIRASVRGGLGLNVVANQLTKLDKAGQSIDGSTANKITALANALQKLSNVGNIKISASIGNQITKIASSLSTLNTTNMSGVEKLVTALQPLSTINKSSGLQSVLKQLSKLPTLAQSLNSMDWNTIVANISRLVNTLEPLAAQLKVVASGLSALPPPLKQIVTITGKIPAANKRAEQSYVNLWAKLDIVKNALRSTVSAIASWITTSNKYVEDMNLFNVAMGQYTSAAQDYAEKVSELMGIDPGEWMRNQGVFMTIITGFGVVSDRAYTISQNLTQLGYDLSSLFNISYEDSFQKLQSGISGELEPLRRLGFDLSVARLQEEALTLGITKNVNAMTQAEKAQLRYYAIMTQVTSAQGDMSRTLEAPANQLRVLQAQVTQCARALGNIFIPTLNAILPYAIALTKVLRLLAEQIATVMGFTLPEVDYSGLQDASNSLGGLGDNADSVASGLEDSSDAAKKLKKNILGIDELNILEPKDDTGSGSGSGAAGGDLDFELPTYDFIGDAVASKADEIVDYITGALGEITATISAFSLAIGTILVVTGANIPIGLALMAVGATGLIAAIATNWNEMSDRLAKVLTLITSMLGGFLLALGAFFVFSGVNVPLGAALMVAGAVSLGTAAAINWKFLEGDLRTALAAITAIVGGALLAIGAFFVFSGTQIPLGAALMAAGAITLATAVALNWNILSDEMKKVLGTLTTIVGGAMIALGAVLAFSGVSLPLGIALMAGGAVSLVAAVALNWGALTKDLKSAITTTTSLVSGAFLGVGAILAWTGVNIPLGVGMMAVGAVGLVATASINWNSLTDKIANVLREIGITVGGSLLALGAVLALSGVGLPLGIALIAAGAASLITGVALNWNAITDKVSSVLNSLQSLIERFSLVIGVVLAMTGVALPLGIALIAGGASAVFGSSGAALNPSLISDSIRSALQSAADVCTDYKTKISNKLNEIKDSFVSAAAGIKNQAGSFAQNFFNGLQSGFSNASSFVRTYITNPIESAFKNINLSQSGKNIVNTIYNGIVSVQTLLPNGLVTIANNAKAKIQNVNWGNVGQTIIGTIYNGFVSLQNKIPDALKTIGNSAKSKLSSINWLNVGKTVVGAIYNGFVSLQNQIPAALATIGNAAKNKFSSIDWISIGKNVILGIKNGITSAIGTITDAAKNAGDWLLNAFKDVLGIHSPSVEGEQLGYWFDAGVAEGVSGNTDLLLDPSQELGETILTAVDTTLDGAGEDLANDFIDETADALKDNMDRISEAISSGPGINNINSIFQAVQSGNWADVAKNVSLGLFKSMDKTFQTNVSSFVADSLDALNDGFDDQGYLGMAKAALNIVQGLTGNLSSNSGQFELAGGGIITALTSGIDLSLPGLWELITSIAKQIVLLFTNGLSGLTGLGSSLIEALGSVFSNGLGGIASGVSGFIGNIGSIFSGGLSGIISGATGSLGSLAGIFSSGFGGIASTVGTAVASAGTALSGLGTAAATALGSSGIVGLAAVAGVAIAGLSSKVNDYAANAKKAAFEAGDYFQGALWSFVETGTWLPAKMFDIGKSLITSLINGIKSIASNLYDIVSDIAGNIGKTLGNIWDGVKNTASNIASSLSNAAGNLWNGVKDVASNVSNTVSNVVSGVGNAVGNVVSGVASGVGNVVSGIGNAVGNVVSGIGNAVSNVVNGVKNTASKVWNGIKNFFGFANGGIITSNGIQYMGKPIPQYANGTSNATGSLFMAGEAGAELVGHINGSTEVLNRFQLAIVMRDAIVNGMNLYTPYWRAILSQMSVSTNAITRSISHSNVNISGNFASDNSYGAYKSLSKTVYHDSTQNKNNDDTSMYDDMRMFYQEYVEPTLKEIASDTKRQADKEETLTVRLGDRDISNAVDRQKKANGYSFTK